MKKLILTAALIATTSVFAQESKSVKKVSTTDTATTSTAEAPVVTTSPTIIHQGFRVAVKKGNYDGTMKFSSIIGSVKRDIDMKDKLGISVGYELLRLQNIGIISNFTFRQFDASFGEFDFIPNKKINAYTLDGSATYAINSMFYGMGGMSLNYTKLPNAVDEDTGKSYEHKPEIGYGVQLGAGWKAHANLSVELMYNYLMYNGKYDVGTELKTEATARGFELGIVGTF